MKRRMLFLVAMIISYFIFVASFSNPSEWGIIGKILGLLGLKPQTTSQISYESPRISESISSDNVGVITPCSDPIPPPPFPPDTTDDPE